MVTSEASIVRWTYVIGIVCLITAAAFYAETWWHIFGRMEQVGITLSFVLLFFVLTLLFQTKHPFFSRLSFIAGFICLGPAIILVGTIYHSQAESYWLFSLWLLPVLLAAVQVKMLSILMLRFLLFQSLLWSLIFPAYQSWSQTGILAGLLTAAAVNAFIYLWSTRHDGPRVLQLGWFAAIHLFAFSGAIRYVLTEVEVFAHLAYLIVLAGSFYMVRKLTEELRITIGFAGLYVFQFVFVSMLDVYSGAVFLVVFLFAAGAVFSIIKLRTLYMKKGMNSKWRIFMLHTVTFVGALIAAAAYAGFFAVFLFDALSTILFISATLLFGFILWKRSLDPYLSQAIVFFALFQMISISFDNIVWQMPILLLITAILWRRIDNLFYRSVVYAAGNVSFLLWLSFLLENMQAVFLIGAGVNLCLTVWGRFGIRIRNLYLIGYSFTLATLFMLPYTVGETQAVYWMYVISYFAAITSLIYVHLKQKDKQVTVITAVFWILFIFAQYIDFLWTQVHVAVSFTLLGIAFIAAAYVMEKRRGGPVSEPEVRWGIAIPVAMLLVIAELIVPAVQSEAVLRNGESIWLEVEHYVSEYEQEERQAYISIYDNLYSEEFTEGSFVYAKLEETNAGSYKVASITDNKEEVEKPYIRGRTDGWGTAEFGLSSYPEPEGEIQDINVRIGADGVAVIEGVRYK